MSFFSNSNIFLYIVEFFVLMFIFVEFIDLLVIVMYV